MKYLLKQNKEDKGILCDKVTIDEFDYYVSGEEIKLNDFVHLDNTIKELPEYNGNYIIQLLDDTLLNSSNALNCKKVISTNNPNIDIPKVVNEDEVDNLLGNIYKQFRTGSFLKRIKCFYAVQLMKIGYNKSQETYSFSEENMIEFLDFSKSTNQEKSFYEMGCLLKGKPIDSKEIFQIWKEQQPIVLLTQQEVV